MGPVGRAFRRRASWVVMMALRTQWRCLEPGCPESGSEGTAKEANAAAEKHGKSASHATQVWSEPTLPVPIPRR